MTKDSITGLPIDNTLTYETARQRGYTYEMEIPRYVLMELRDDFKEFMKVNKFKLGQAIGPWVGTVEEQTSFGWYRPVSAPSEEESTP